MNTRKGLLLLFFVLAFFSNPILAFSREIYYLKAEGIVNPVLAEFIVESIDDAAKAEAEAVVIELDTPGGLDLSMRDIIKAMLASDVPVVVYVAPSGSRAASAGVFITYAANVAAMAPGTNIGSAHPVAMGGGQMDETMAKKVENDAVAYLKGIAAKRKRNVEWAEKAVRESVNITAEEALKLRVIDIVASSRTDLLEKIEGRKVELPAGERTLSIKGAEVVDIEMDLRARILNAISNPNVAYVLMMIGLIGLYFELSNPGLIFPGVIGAVCLVLAFYAFQTLSVNYAGLILIALGAIFFILEIKITSFGLLAIAGIISIILGSLMLFESPFPFMRLSIWVILPTVVIMATVVLATMYYALRIHRRGAVSGAEGMLKDEGFAVDDIPAGGEGEIFIDGEYWKVVTEDELRKGDRVRVVEMRGLMLKVAKKKEA